MTYFGVPLGPNHDDSIDPRGEWKDNCGQETTWQSSQHSCTLSELFIDSLKYCHHKYWKQEPFLSLEIKIFQKCTESLTTYEKTFLFLS